MALSVKGITTRTEFLIDKTVNKRYRRKCQRETSVMPNQEMPADVAALLSLAPEWALPTERERNEGIRRCRY
jgi:hypothetical protein